MIKNPYLNALVAVTYIVLIVFGINSVATFSHDSEDTIFIPMVMLSLLVLSASIMGVLFFYEPARLFIENQKHEALVFFGKTVGTFALCALVLVALLLYASIQ